MSVINILICSCTPRFSSSHYSFPDNNKKNWWELSDVVPVWIDRCCFLPTVESPLIWVFQLFFKNLITTEKKTKFPSLPRYSSLHVELTINLFFSLTVGFKSCPSWIMTIFSCNFFQCCQIHLLIFASCKQNKIPAAFKSSPTSVTLMQFIFSFFILANSQSKQYGNSHRITPSQFPIQISKTNTFLNYVFLYQQVG